MIKKIFLICAAFVLFSSGVYALSEPEYKIEDDVLTVKANTEEARQMVGMLILKFGTSLDEVSENNLSGVLYADQQLSKNDKSVEFKADISDAETGKTFTVCLYDDQNSDVLQLSVIKLDYSLSDREKAQWDIEKTELSYNGTDGEIQLPKTAPLSVGYGGALSWSSQSEGVTVENDKAYIDREKAGGKTVELCVTVTHGSESESKIIVLNVAALTDSERCELDKSELGLEYSGTETEISLPETGKHGSTLIWTLDENNSFAAKIENSVLKIDYSQITENTDIVLNCRLTYGGITAEKAITLTLLPLNAEGKARADIALISISYNGTAESFVIPATGEKYQSRLTYTSSDLSVIEPLGGVAAVHRSGLYADKTVILRVAASDFENIQREFSILVKAGATVPSGGGGGGGGASGGSASISYTKPNSASQNTDNPAAEENNLIFSDLSGFEWAKSSIETLYKSGIVNGKSKELYAPLDNVKRGEFVKMIVGAFNLSGESNIDFYDVPGGHWCRTFVAAAVKNGVVSGVSSDYFGTDENITREDMAVMIFRCLNKNEIGEQTCDFTDFDSVSPYAKDAVAYLSKNGIISGYENNTFAPKNNANRAEAAVIINRCLDYCVPKSSKN